MPLPAATLRFPHERVLLHRTRLAYVHLRNLLTDAKRDRAARVYGYVVVWLPEELLLLYLQEGEVVNTTASGDGQHFRALAITEALAKVPSAAEFGDICFHQCEDEQLATMYWSQVREPIPWPSELKVHDRAAVLGFLLATMHDGVVEVRADGGLNYGVVREGRVVRGFFADTGVGAAAHRSSPIQAPTAAVSAAVSVTGSRGLGLESERRSRDACRSHKSLRACSATAGAPSTPSVTSRFTIAAISSR